MTNFELRIYEIVRHIPRGKVASYGAVARCAGNPGASRAVGNALNKNYDPAIPCHRVVGVRGDVGGFNRGKRKKITLLRSEGVEVRRFRAGKEYMFEFA